MNHHNFKYNTEASPYPLAVGDRYYAQDMLRDFYYKMHATGQVILDTEGAVPIIMSGGVAAKGTGNTLNISECLGYVYYEVSVPDDGSLIPATVKQEDIIARVLAETQTDMSVPDAVLDNVTTNYIKLRYAEADVNTRARAKKEGSYVFEVSPSYEYIVDEVSPTDYDIVLGEFISVAGAIPATIDTSNRTTQKIIYTIAPNYYYISDDLTIGNITSTAHIRVTNGTNLKQLPFPPASANLEKEIIVHKDDTSAHAIKLIPNESYFHGPCYSLASNLYLFDKHQEFHFKSDGTNWVTKSPIRLRVGQINRDSWNQAVLGMMKYDITNVSGTFIEGEMIQESTSGTTWILYNSQSTYHEVLNATGKGYATDANVITGIRSGATATINGTSKNVNNIFAHKLNVKQEYIKSKLIIARSNTDLYVSHDTYVPIQYDFSSPSYAVGFEEVYVNDISCYYKIGLAGIGIFVTSTGQPERIITSDYMYGYILEVSE